MIVVERQKVPALKMFTLCLYHFPSLKGWKCSDCLGFFEQLTSLLRAGMIWFKWVRVRVTAPWLCAQSMWVWLCWQSGIRGRRDSQIISLFLSNTPSILLKPSDWWSEMWCVSRLCWLIRMVRTTDVSEGLVCFCTGLILIWFLCAGVLGVWSSSSSALLEVESRSGVAVARDTGTVTVYYEIAGQLRTYREVSTSLNTSYCAQCKTNRLSRSFSSMTTDKMKIIFPCVEVKHILFMIFRFF